MKRINLPQIEKIEKKDLIVFSRRSREIKGESNCVLQELLRETQEEVKVKEEQLQVMNENHDQFDKDEDGQNDKYADHLNEDYDQDGQFDKDEDGQND